MPESRRCRVGPAAGGGGHRPWASKVVDQRQSWATSEYWSFKEDGDNCKAIDRAGLRACGRKKTDVVQAFRPAVSGRPKGLHYFRIDFSHALKASARDRLVSDSSAGPGGNSPRSHHPRRFSLPEFPASIRTIALYLEDVSRRRPPGSGCWRSSYMSNGFLYFDCFSGDRPATCCRLPRLDPPACRSTR
jgi:hypothetical protein